MAGALSGVEGIRKPDVGLFEIAARRCGTSLTDGGWMIGDHLTKDIAGGRNADLHTVWINRGPTADHEQQADHTVTQTTEAVQVLLRNPRLQRHPL
nr:HAD hydrolase-like protein [Sphaerisporangium album]